LLFECSGSESLRTSPVGYVPANPFLHLVIAILH